MKAQIENAVMIGLLALFAIGALFVAGKGEHGAAYWGGLGFFAIFIGLIFYQISRAKFGGKNSKH